MTGTAAARRNLDVIPGANTFLAVVPAEGQAVAPTSEERQINVVLNWFEELKPRMPAP